MFRVITLFDSFVAIYEEEKDLTDSLSIELNMKLKLSQVCKMVKAISPDMDERNILDLGFDWRSVGHKLEDQKQCVDLILKSRGIAEPSDSELGRLRQTNAELRLQISKLQEKTSCFKLKNRTKQEK